MDKEDGKIKISVKNTTNNAVVKPTRRPRMDFAPAKNQAARKIVPRVPKEELTRRELARQQVSRREEIHRQIEAQNEADIIARHRADAARRELARKRAVEEEASRARSEKEAARAEIVRLERAQARAQERLERVAAEERKRVVAQRRADAARRELARRQATDLSLSRRKTVVKNPKTSTDPVALQYDNYEPALPTPRSADPDVKREVSVKADGDTRRFYGQVSEPTPVVTRAEREYRAMHPELIDQTVLPKAAKRPRVASAAQPAPSARAARSSRYTSVNPEDLGDLNDFVSEVDEDGYDEMGEIEDIEDIEEAEKTLRRTAEEDEDTSANNYRYILGGRSPFINTENLEKRPLSGNNDGIDTEHLQRPGARLGKKLLGGPNAGDYVSPAEDPRARERERARRLAEEDSRAEEYPELLDDNLATNPRYVPYEEPIPHKTLYARRKEALKDEKDDVPTMVVADGDKSSGLALAFVVFLTILLGAIVGVIAYLAFFQ